MHPKTFYSTYLANDNIYEIDQMLVTEVLKHNPDEVFDFGCGTGKNLRLIRERSRKPVNLCGLDLSLLNTIYARSRNDIPFVITGDEYFLCRLRAFHTSITCSVLCHIQNIDNIVEELKRLSYKNVIIAETNDVAGEYYYPHNYESYGFVDTGRDWYSEINKATYKIYKYAK